MKTLVTYALLGFAAAANVAPNVPVSGQIGALNFGITCNTPIGSKTFAGYFTATAPIQGITGAQIYYDDLVAFVTIPGSITQFAGVIGGTQADAIVQVALNLDNASPSNFQVFPNGYEIDNIPITAGQPVTVRVPVNNGTLAPIGPVTLGDAGKTHLIHLGEVDIQVYILNSFGAKIFGPLNITCPPPSIPYDIGIVNILPTSAGSIEGNQSNGGKSNFANITNNFETGSFRFPYSCSFGGIGKSDVDLSITGTVPTYANPGQQFSITDAYAYLRGNPAFVKFLKGAHPTATSGKVAVKNYTLTVADGFPTTLQVINSTNPIVSTASLGSSGFGVAFPSASTLTIGPITAGLAGQELFLTSGPAAGSIEFFDASAKSLGSNSFTCSPKFASQLIGIPVTLLQAPAIDS